MKDKEIFKKIRELEKLALSCGVLKSDDVQSYADIRYEAWFSYLISRKEYLEHCLKDYKADVEYGL